MKLLKKNKTKICEMINNMIIEFYINKNIFDLIIIK